MKEIAAAVAEESGKKAGSIVIEDVYKTTFGKNQK